MKKKIAIGLALLLLLPIAWLFLRKNNIVSLETARTSLQTQESQYFEWENISCHYTKMGNGPENVVLIHGFGGSHKNFDLFAPLLAEKYTVYAIDLPAFGLSEVPSLDLPDNEIIEMYRAYFDYTFSYLNLDTFHLLGNSLGGWMAWDYTSRNPQKVSSLCLLNSAGFGMAQAREAATSWMTGPLGGILFKKGIPLSISQSNAERCLWNPEKVNKDKVAANHIMNNKEGTFDWMMKMAQSTVLPDTTALANITCKTLVVWGDTDAIVSVANAPKFEAAIPGSKLLIYENCGHIPQIEYPEKLAQDWLAFVMN